jgi:hypothetical protein
MCYLPGGDFNRGLSGDMWDEKVHGEVLAVHQLVHQVPTITQLALFETPNSQVFLISLVMICNQLVVCPVVGRKTHYMISLQYRRSILENERLLIDLGIYISKVHPSPPEIPYLLYNRCYLEGVGVWKRVKDKDEKCRNRERKKN